MSDASRRSRAPWRLAVVPVAVAAVVAGPLPAGAEPVAETTLVGTVRLLAADTLHPDYVAGGHDHAGHDHGDVGSAGLESPHEGSEDVYVPVLETGGDTLLLTGDEAEDIKPNTSVEVSGTVAGEQMAVSSAEVVGAASVSAIPSSGNVRTLVLLASWPGLAPDTVTPASAAQQMFGATNDWFGRVSHGAASMTGDVTPWLSIAGPAGNRCYSDHMAVMTQAKNAAVAAGYTLANYDNFVVYHPYAGGLTGNDCAWYSGWAYVGSTGVWLNGAMDDRTTVHELGHNYGLYHSHSYLCPDGAVGGTGCSFSDYGDYYDAMGSSGYVGSFNASQKSLLGWMTGRSVNLSAGGSATLVPMAQSAAGVRGAYVTVAGGRSYWLEYRQPTGVDTWLPPQATDGVLVHLRDDAFLQAAEPSLWFRDTGSALLDVRPADGVSVSSATLRSGESWTTPEGVVISVGAVSAAGAQVTVANDVLPPSAPQSVLATGQDGQATVTWQAPADPGGSPIVSYRVTASPGGASVTVGESARTATINGLTNGTWYRFSVSATNGQATGPTAASNELRMTDGTVPTVTARTPAPNARTIAANSVVTATLSEPVVGVDASSFVLYGPNWQPVPATVTYDSGTRTATLDPTVDLTPRTRYAVDLVGSIRDSGYNWLPYTTWSFSTGPGPAVTTRGPGVNALAVAVGANVTAQFNVPVTGISTATVQLRTSGGAVVPAAVTYNATTRTVTLNPNANLAADHRYTVTLVGGPTALRDTVDNPLATTSWSFVTGAAPGLAARTPGHGQTGVPVAANATVRFSEPVRGVSTTTVQLKTPSGKLVPAAVSYNATTRTATLNPGPTLARGTWYTVVVTGGPTTIRDGIGNPFRTVAWSFRTQ